MSPARRSACSAPGGAHEDPPRPTTEAARPPQAPRARRVVLEDALLELTDQQKFLFDLQGFLVVPAVLSETEVISLNEAIDASLDRLELRPQAGVGSSKTLAGSPENRGVFRGLLTLP